MTLCNFSRHNILLDATPTPKVTDFGFVTPMPVNVGSTAIVTAAGSMTLAGSRGYTAPEFTEGRHGIKSDVYSYGVVSFSYIQILAKQSKHLMTCFLCSLLLLTDKFWRPSVVCSHILRTVKMRNW